MLLEGRVALVTGAGGMHGIGRAIALRLAHLGADVALTDIKRPPEDLPKEEVDADWKSIESVSAEIERLGRRCAAIYCDLTQEKQIIRLIDEVVSRLGGLHLLVNNARAIIGWDRGPLVELDTKFWDRVMSVNTRGTYLCCKYAVRYMIKEGVDGRIINMSSTAGKRGIPYLAAYSASKFAIIGLTQSLAHELAPYKITVNAICPGVTDTHRLNYSERALAEKKGITVEELREQILAKRAETIPLKRVATPEDVAMVAGFLASPEASYLTGQSINVCGGEIMF